jgi:hypothetical protein
MEPLGNRRSDNEGAKLFRGGRSADPLKAAVAPV